MDIDFKLLPSSSLKKKFNNKSIYFMHIPKCGGTTIDHIFLKLSLVLKTFSFKRYRYINCNKFQIKSDASYLPSFLSGHLDYNFSENIKDVFTFSIVREPVDRIISNYKFNIYKFNKNQNQYPFKEFIENEEKLNRDNLITRHFSGLLCNQTKIKNDDKNFAIKNAHLFDKINIFKNWDYFVSDILSSLGLPSVFYSRFQETKKNILFKPSKYDLELIKKYYEYDFEIYNSIKESLSVNIINKKNYNKEICLVSPHLKTENKLLNEEQIKKIFNVK